MIGGDHGFKEQPDVFVCHFGCTLCLQVQLMAKFTHMHAWHSSVFFQLFVIANLLHTSHRITHEKLDHVSLGFYKLRIHVFRDPHYMYLLEKYNASIIPILDKTSEHAETIEFRLVYSDPLYQFTADVFVSVRLQLTIKHDCENGTRLKGQALKTCMHCNTKCMCYNTKSK